MRSLRLALTLVAVAVTLHATPVVAGAQAVATIKCKDGAVRTLAPGACARHGGVRKHKKLKHRKVVVTPRPAGPRAVVRELDSHLPSSLPRHPVP